MDYSSVMQTWHQELPSTTPPYLHTHTHISPSSMFPRASCQAHTTTGPRGNLCGTEFPPHVYFFISFSPHIDSCHGLWSLQSTAAICDLLLELRNLVLHCITVGKQHCSLVAKWLGNSEEALKVVQVKFSIIQTVSTESDCTLKLLLPRNPLDQEVGRTWKINKDHSLFQDSHMDTHMHIWS